MELLFRVLSICKDTANICSGSAFKCLSSLLWRSPRSCLGNIYSSKIFNMVSHHLPLVRCYADDFQLYLSFNPSCAVSQDEAITSMETCISEVKQWMTADKLMLNDDKTEFLVIASQHLLKKAAINTIRVGDCDVGKVSVVRNLGMWFDDQVTMVVHITKICSVTFYPPTQY